MYSFSQLLVMMLDTFSLLLPAATTDLYSFKHQKCSNYDFNRT